MNRFKKRYKTPRRFSDQTRLKNPRRSHRKNHHRTMQSTHTTLARVIARIISDSYL